MVETIKDRIIKTLIETLDISEKDVKEALAFQKRKGISLDKALIERGLIKEEDLMALLVKELQIPFINLKKYKIDPNLKGVIPEKVARQYRIIPLSSLEDTITVAISDPLNLFAIDDLKNITGSDIDVVMSTDSDIMKSIDNYYGSKFTTSVQEVSKDILVDDFEIVMEKDPGKDDETSSDEGEQAPIIRLVNLMIRESIKQRASDIHIEPLEDVVRVRYRIDGVLQDAMNFPKDNQNSVIVRIKIMSRLDITATRTPQDGRFKMRIANNEVDFRVSLLPTTFGQKIVMRILDKKNLQVGLEGLGFAEGDLVKMKESVKSPFGMILVTGPTGSGKSTTLYSVINELNTVDRNIITIEDPVEYVVEGLTQIFVRPEIGLTFASGLKSILRQSPDIVMVGEIRDFETADIAIKASLTGQLVFSTLHTNDAAGAMTRLVDMGVEPFLVASSLVMICAQRLCRRVCSRCKVEENIPEEVLRRLNIPAKSGTKFYKGKGCSHCRQSGYYGRLGVTEVLIVDDPIREMLISGKTSDEIKCYARESNNMTLLWDDMVEKFMGGLTSLEEVIRVASNE